ncbi:MAG: RDD family protein [Acidobacteriia bacterium]|nr:RDD family protein [Terriglobia bacterium]
MLPDHSGHCRYCDTSSDETISRGQSADAASASASLRRVPLDPSVDPAWRNELASRLAAYRTRRRRPAANDAQSDLPFEAIAPAAVALAEPPLLDLPPSSGAAPQSEEFAFTIAIGRSAKPALDSSDLPGEFDASHMEIDVSQPSSLPGFEAPEAQASSPRAAIESQLYPVASLADRVMAGFFDGACLLLAYGGFFLFFTTFGGEFTSSKLTAAVGLATFAIFYFQYFALFTVLAGATPGMMLRGLRITSFPGEPPALRQLLLRSLGYLFSAASFLLGFLWAYWDEDSLTWHDRLSHTYLTSAESLLNDDVQDALEGR